jgi:phosphate-selective porin OprO/OprP
MMYKPKGIIFILGCVLLYNTAAAQIDERYQEENTEKFVESTDSIQILKLKKSYVLGNGFTIRSANGIINLTQSLQTSYAVNSLNKDFSAINSTFNINRARLSFSANLFDNKYSIYGRLNLSSDHQSATSGNRTFNTVLQEAYFEYRPNLNNAFNIGLRADYIDSREVRIEGESLGFINRSAVSSSFDAIFDYGIRYKGNYKLGGRHLLRPYISVTTGDSRSSLRKNYGGFKYGIRLDYLPFDKFSKGGEFYMDDLAIEQKPKLVIGTVFSYNNGASSAIGTNGGRYLYGDINQKLLLPNYLKFGADFLFKYNGFYAMGSYFSTKATLQDGITGEFKLNGQFTPYATTQTVEQTRSVVLSRLSLGEGYHVQAGYLLPSLWSLAGRYAYLDADVSSLNFANYNKYYTLVATKYLSGHNLKFQVEVGFDELKKSLRTTSQVGNYYTQLMVTVQL